MNNQAKTKVTNLLTEAKMKRIETLRSEIADLAADAYVDCRSVCVGDAERGVAADPDSPLCRALSTVADSLAEARDTLLSVAFIQDVREHTACAEAIKDWIAQ